MKPVLEVHPYVKEKITGKSCEVRALTKDCRNFAAHKDPKDPKNKIAKDLRAEFDWLVMRCFSLRYLKIIPNSVLKQFAKNFQDYDDATFQDLLKKGLMIAPILAFFIVRVFFLDKSEKESVLYFDPKEQLKTFQDKVRFGRQVLWGPFRLT